MPLLALASEPCGVGGGRCNYYILTLTLTHRKFQLLLVPWSGWYKCTVIKVMYF